MSNSIGPVDIEFALKNVNFQAETEKMKREIAGISTTTKNEADKTKSSLSGIGDMIGDIGGKAAIAGAAVAAAFKFKQLAQEAYEFEMAFGMAMREVQTISKATQDNMEGISQSIVDMAANGPDDAITLAKAYYQIVSAGQDGAAGLELLAVASKAATAGVTDTLTAADGLTTVINAWGLSADQANMVADVMFKTVERGKTTFSQLASNIAQVAPLASANGIGLNEIFAALQSITKQGTPTAQAMTQIRSSIINMNNSLGDGWSKTMTYQEGLNKIAEMAGGSATALKKLIPDVEGMSAVLALTGEKAKGAAEDLNETTKAAGSMETAYGRMMEEANNKWSVVHNKWTREMRELGKAAKEESTNIANFMDALLSNGSDIDSKFTVTGITDRMKAMNIMGGDSWGNKIMSYITAPFVPDASVQQGYDKYVKNIVNYAKKGLSEQQIKLGDIIGIKDKDERLAKLNEFLISMKAAEQDLGDTALRNSQEQNEALNIRSKLFDQLNVKAKEAIKTIESEASGSGGATGKGRNLKTMLDELKTAQNSLGTGSMEDDIAYLAKISALKDEIKAYYDKIREARKAEQMTAIKPLLGKESLGGVQAITKEQSKQEFQGDKLLKQSKARTTEAQKQADAIKEQNDAYTYQTAFLEGLTGKLGDAGELLGAMSYAVGEFDSTLGESVGKMADIANNAANMVASYASGNFVGAIASGIGVLGNIAGLTKSDKEDPTIAALERINNLLKQQSSILANIAGSNYFDLAAKQYADLGVAIDLNTEKLRSARIFTRKEWSDLQADFRDWQNYSPNPQIKFTTWVENKWSETNQWSPDDFIAAYANGSILLDEQQLAWVVEMTEKQRQRAELLQETFRQALGFDSSNVSDSIFQGVKDGLRLSENGLGGFAKAFGELMKDALMQSVTDAMEIEITKSFLPKYKDAMSDGILSEQERGDLEAIYAGLVKQGQIDADNIKTITDQYLGGTASTKTPITGVAASATEDSVSAMVGQLMAVRVDIKSILINQTASNEDVTRSLLYQKEIAENTRFNKELKPISDKLSNIERVLVNRL